MNNIWKKVRVNLRSYYKLRTGISNLFLRSISLSAKFILTIYIAKYYSTVELGMFNLFTISITILMYFVGWDFYTYSNREILKNKDENKNIILNQLLFHTVIFIFLSPFIGIIFLINIIPIKYILIFYILLYLESISQEIYRILIAMSYSVKANIVFLVRTAFWIYLFIFLGFSSSKGSIEFSAIYYLWGTSSFISIVLGGYFIYKKMDFKSKDFTIKINWIKKGAIVSFPFFLSTILLKTIEFADRYIIDFYFGKEFVGFYSFFFSIANITNIFVVTGVISIIYPRLIVLYENNNLNEFDFHIKKMIKQVILVSFFLSIILIISIHPILNIIGKREFKDYVHVFYILLGSSFLLNLSYIPHYILYAYGLDKKIIKSVAIAVVISLVLSLFLIPTYGLVGAATSLLATNFSILLLKMLYLTKTKVK
ncbi:oligosaccharide flippase family protein [Rossellomorea sp. LjRoot5]|uniref:oligosaccharide flippase family protein n=1 Tax=Rossellomorea sp. LjRoot5 TaxID=3342331 RepID=UPI003ECF16DB